MLPDLAEAAAMPLERANSISTTSEHIGAVPILRARAL
jgi:hypothetical protein